MLLSVFDLKKDGEGELDSLEILDFFQGLRPGLRRLAEHRAEVVEPLDGKLEMIGDLQAGAQAEPYSNLFLAWLAQAWKDSFPRSVDETR